MSNASLTLITPNRSYLPSYYEACAATWGYVHNNYILHNPKEYDKWQHNIFDIYEQQRMGINLPHGYVPSATYWMVDTDLQQYIGTVNIRLSLNDVLTDYGGHTGFIIRFDMRGHGYGKHIFDLSLEAAHKLGISPILYTCILTNEASHKILLSGRYIRKEYDKTTADGVFCDIGRFWYE